MNKTNIIPFILLILFVLVSCNDTFEFHKKYTKDGEIIYVTKIHSLKSLPGNGRFKITGWISNAFTVNEFVVSWNKGENSQAFPYTKSENPNDFIELIIDGLEEGSYEFKIFSKDADGNQSIKGSIFGNVYGEFFRSNLVARKVKDVAYNGTDAEISFNISGDAFQRDTEIKYTNSSGEEVIVIVTPDETVTVLTNMSSNNSVMYRTYYVPTLANEDGDETSIDFFPSDWESLELSIN
ncbi:MAG: DUF4998 domain-containing protein [Tenacibaculum sp.]